MPPLPFWILVSGLVGLIVGSYLNVLIHRLPREISTVLPPSACPSCGTPIRWYDNLPVASWLLLRGQCRACRARISVRYPLVELAAGAAFAGATAHRGFALAAVATALLAWLLIALACIDFEHLLLPDKLTLTGIAVGLGFQLVLPDGALAHGLVGALAGAGFLLVVAGLWELARGVEGMGLGDVKMLAMIGAFVGLGGVVVTLVVATLLGSIVGVGLVASGRGSFSARLPFGVFLALGGLAASFAGPWLIALYLGLAR